MLEISNINLAPHMTACAELELLAIYWKLEKLCPK